MISDSYLMPPPTQVILLRTGMARMISLQFTLPCLHSPTARHRKRTIIVMYFMNRITTNWIQPPLHMNGIWVTDRKSRSLEAEHCFAQPGTYLVQLNIIDKLTTDVLISQATYSFTVEKIEQPYIQCSDTVFSGSQISLNGRETYLKDFTIRNYYWDFGDGSVAQGIDSNTLLTTRAPIM